MKSRVLLAPSSLAIAAAACFALPGAPAFAQAAGPANDQPAAPSAGADTGAETGPAAASGPAGAPAATAAAGEQTAAAGPGDIIVTARRRAENLLKTPIAISAMTSQDIAARAIVSLTDLATNTPGVNITSASSGRSDRSFQQVALRGFIPTTAVAILVSTFIDGVPVASATAVNSISDPERIEILKGPQAAYFGRNTFAGAINVVNKLPGNDLRGNVSASVGTRDYHDVQGAIEGALIPDVLTFRITGRDFAKNGSYHNGANPGETLGDQSTRTGTALAVFKPTDNFTVKAFGLLSRDRDGPSAQGALFAYELRSNNGVLNIPALSGNSAGTLIAPNSSNCTLSGFPNGLAATETRVNRPYFCGALPSLPAGFPQANTVEDRLLGAVLANPTFRYHGNETTDGYGLYRKFYHTHLNVDWKIGDTGITLSSLSGLNYEHYSELADLDNYDGSSLRNPANPTGANLNLRTTWDFPFVIERATRDWSQEVRATYDNGGPLTATLGGSYLLTKVEPVQLNVQAEIITGTARLATTRSSPQKSRTYAAFGGVTYNVTPELKISAEGRYEIDRIYAYSGGNPAGLVLRAGNAFGLPAQTVPALTAYYYKDYKKFLPRIIAQFDINKDAMVYASYSKGANITIAQFNTNFLNGSPTVQAAAAAIGIVPVIDPEELDNYEVGFKGKLFDGRVRAQLAAYYAVWKNQQNVRSATLIDEPPPGGTGLVTAINGNANTGRSIMKGLEADITAVPIEGLTLTIAGALNDSDIRAFSDPSISRISGFIGNDFRGNQLPNISKYSANLGAQYGTPIPGWDEGAWFIRGDLSYKSKIYVNPSNLYWIKARTQANFRIGVSRGPFSLEGFVTNAFNNKNYTSALDQSILTPNAAANPQLTASYSYILAALPDLRTFGLKASFKF